ncbi:MAG: SUMF1/EgtB/PvdO family nonheme iron enzyme [Verrucomicrobiota bacterium]
MQSNDQENLHQRVARSPAGRLTCLEVEGFLEPLLVALESLHQRGMVHGGLTPAHVRFNPQGQLSLADVGQAQSAGHPADGASVPGGFLGYASPQQRRGETPQVSDDIYSLGAVLYHLLTGELPYSVELTPGDGPIPPPRDPRRVLRGRTEAGRRDIAPEAALTLMRCLAGRAADRPPDIDTFRRCWKYGPDPDPGERRTGDGCWKAAAQTLLLLGMLVICLGALGVITWDLWLGQRVEEASPGWAKLGDTRMDQLETALGKGRASPVLNPGDVANPAALVDSLAGPSLADPPAARIRGLFETNLQARLAARQIPREAEPALVRDIVENLNRVIRDESLWDARAFAGVVRPDEDLGKRAAGRPRRRERRSLNLDLVAKALPNAFLARVSTGPPEKGLVTLEIRARWVPAELCLLGLRLARLSGEAILWERVLQLTNCLDGPPPGRPRVRERKYRTISGTVELEPGVLVVEGWLSDGATRWGWASNKLDLSVTGGPSGSQTARVEFDFTPARLQVFSTRKAPLELWGPWTNLVASASASDPGHFQYQGLGKQGLWRMKFNKSEDGFIEVLPGPYQVRVTPMETPMFLPTRGDEGWVVCPPGARTNEAVLDPQPIHHARLGLVWTHSTNIAARFIPVGGKAGFLAAEVETSVANFQRFIDQTGHPMGPMLSLTNTGMKELGRFWSNAFPAEYARANLPVVGVSWYDAASYCDWLTREDARAGAILPDWRYKLPSSAQWSQMVGEHRYPWGDTFPPRNTQGNYARIEMTKPPTEGGALLPGEPQQLLADRDRDWHAARVEAYWPKAWREWLLDDPAPDRREDPFPFPCAVDTGARKYPEFLHLGGNVAEWCDTWYRAESGARQNTNLPSRLRDDKGGEFYRVVRGESWAKPLNDEVKLRADSLWVERPDHRSDQIGFRVILVDERNERP